MGLSEEVIGKTRQQIPEIELSALQWDHYQRLLDARETFYEFELPIRCHNQRLVWHAISGEPVHDKEGVFAGYRGTGRDVTQRHESEALIRTMAFQDVLTGLANRRLFIDRLQQALISLRRTGQCAVLMFLDLDRFKSLNDQRGHAAGDRLLQHVAQRLTSCVRGVDTVARLGGDEFTILMEDLDADELQAMVQARLAADKVSQVLAVEFDLGDEFTAQPYVCGVSVGVVVLHDPNESADSCLSRADAAMYRAKETRRGRAWIDTHEELARPLAVQDSR